MKYGYARVSTDGQSVDAQVRQLTKAGNLRLIGHVASDHGIWKCDTGWYWWLNGVGYSCSGYIVMREQHNKKPSMPAHHIGRNEDGCALDRR